MGDDNLIGIRVEVKGMEEAKQIATHLTKDLESSATEGLNELGREAVNYAKEIAEAQLPSRGNRSDTPSYYDSFGYSTPAKMGSSLIVHVYNTHQWAQAVEEGTRPHMGKPMFHVPPQKVAAYPWRLQPDAGGYITFYQHGGAKGFYIMRQTGQYVRAIYGARIISKIRDRLGRYMA